MFYISTFDLKSFSVTFCVVAVNVSVKTNKYCDGAQDTDKHLLAKYLQELALSRTKVKVRGNDFCDNSSFISGLKITWF